MNLLDAVVTDVHSEPRQVVSGEVSWWEVDVTYTCWGRESRTWLTSSTEEGAKAICVGYKFLT